MGVRAITEEQGGRAGKVGLATGVLQVFQANLGSRARGVKRAVEASKENQDQQDLLEREVSREPLESLEDQDWKEEKVVRESLGYQGGQESKGDQEQKVLLTQTWQSLENLDP